MLIRPSIALLLLAAACGGGDDGGGGDGAGVPRPCTLVTEAEMEALVNGPLDAPREDSDTCTFASPASVDASVSVIASVTRHTFDDTGHAGHFYDTVTGTTMGTAAAGAGERAYCSPTTSFAGAQQRIVYAQVKRFVVQVSVIHPTPTCELGVAIAAKAAGRL